MFDGMYSAILHQPCSQGTVLNRRRQGPRSSLSWHDTSASELQKMGHRWTQRTLGISSIAGKSTIWFDDVSERNLHLWRISQLVTLPEATFFVFPHGHQTRGHRWVVSPCVRQSTDPPAVKLLGVSIALDSGSPCWLHLWLIRKYAFFVSI